MAVQLRRRAALSLLTTAGVPPAVAELAAAATPSVVDVDPRRARRGPDPRLPYLVERVIHDRNRQLALPEAIRGQVWSVRSLGAAGFAILTSRYDLWRLARDGAAVLISPDAYPEFGFAVDAEAGLVAFNHQSGSHPQIRRLDDGSRIPVKGAPPDDSIWAFSD